MACYRISRPFGKCLCGLAPAMYCAVLECMTPHAPWRLPSVPTPHQMLLLLTAAESVGLEPPPRELLTLLTAQVRHTGPCRSCLTHPAHPYVHIATLNPMMNTMLEQSCGCFTSFTRCHRPLAAVTRLPHTAKIRQLFLLTEPALAVLPADLRYAMPLPCGPLPRRPPGPAPSAGPPPPGPHGRRRRGVHGAEVVPLGGWQGIYPPLSPN